MGGVAQSGFKAAALASASASWKWGVARRFACTSPSKAALCAGLKSGIRTAWRHFKEMISRVLENQPIFRFPRIRAGKVEKAS